VPGRFNGGHSEDWRKGFIFRQLRSNILILLNFPKGPIPVETTKPAADDFLQQQARFDDFVDCYSNERPRQALDMQCPTQLYRPSSKPYRGQPNLDYPFPDKAVTVTTCGRICFNRRKINLSQVFAGQTVGIKQTDDRIWLVSFMSYDLGYFDDETCRLEPPADPFGPKVLPMSSE